MGIRVECDWCRQPIAAGQPYVTVEIDGKIGADDASGPARVYCGDDLRGCGRRLLGVLEGNPVGRADMGLQWELVPVEGLPKTTTATGSMSPGGAPDETVFYGGQQITPELYAFMCSRVSTANKFALPRAGIVSLEQAAAMSDDELLAIRGVGAGTVGQLRDWIFRRGRYDGISLARELHELIADRLPSIDEDDPLREAFAEWVPILRTAVAS